MQTVPFLTDVVQDRLYGYPHVSIFRYASINVLCSCVYNGKVWGKIQRQLCPDNSFGSRYKYIYDHISTTISEQIIPGIFAILTCKKCAVP